MKFVIPAEKRSLITTLCQHIDTHYDDSAVSIIVNKQSQSLTLVSGREPLYAQCTFILDEGSTSLKDKQFAIDGSFAKQLLHYFPDVNEPMCLNLESSASGVTYLELLDKSPLSQGPLSKAALRRCLCHEVVTEHVTYLEDNRHRPTTTTSKAVIERILHEAEEHLPFEFMELNKEQQHLRIQRNGEVEDKSLPLDMKLPLSIVLTAESTEQMTKLCRMTSSNEIEIAQQGEAVTFKTPECTLTCSLAGIEAFYQKKPDPITPLNYFVVDVYAFKDEIRHCLKEYGKIKQSNDALLYLGEDEAAICVLTEPYEFVHPIHVHDVGQSTHSHGGSLFRFAPRDLLKSKIKDLTNAKKTKLVLFETSRGELNLGMYYTTEDQLPFDRIPIEKDNRNLSKVLKMMAKVIDAQHEQPQKMEKQQDLFGFNGDDS